MHYNLAANERVVAELHSPSGLGAYRQEIPYLSLQVRARDSDTAYCFVISGGSSGEANVLRRDATMRGLRLADATSRWRQQVFDVGASSDVDSLTETVEAVLEIVSEFGPTALSLFGMHPNTVHVEHLAALLRASSSWRHEIPGWDEALAVATAAANVAHIDVNDVLFGMI